MAGGKPSTGEELHGLRPALRSGRFFHLPKLGPACLLSERNSPAPRSRENALDPALPAGIRTTLSSRKLLQNGNSFRELISLLLRIPVILAEPSQRFTYVCHFENPLGLLAGSIVVISSELRYLLTKKILLIRFGKRGEGRPGTAVEFNPRAAAVGRNRKERTYPRQGYRWRSGR